MGDAALKKPWIGPLLAVVLVWSFLIYLLPLAVGYSVKAIPLRVISSGIFWDQTATTLNGYRAIVWSPVIGGVLLAFLAGHLRVTPFVIAMGMLGSTFAATLLTFGAAIGFGPGGTLLVGLEMRWVWKIFFGAVGAMVGLVGMHLLKARAEDHDLQFAPIRQGMLLGGFGIGALMILLAPGPILGKVMTGGGSWLGSLIWLLGL